MAHSFISYGNNEIRLHDSDIAVAVYFMNLACSKNPSMFSKELVSTVLEWRKSVNQAPPGMADFGFDEFSNRDELMMLLRESLNQLATFGEKVPKSFLNEQTSTKRELFIDDYSANDIKQTLIGIKGLLAK